MPFRFNVMAAATPMTRDEFVARQTADAQRLRARGAGRSDRQRGAGEPGGRRRTPGSTPTSPRSRRAGLLRPEDRRRRSASSQGRQHTGRAGERRAGRPGRQPDRSPASLAASSSRCTSGTATRRGPSRRDRGLRPSRIRRVRRVRHPDPGAARRSRTTTSACRTRPTSRPSTSSRPTWAWTASPTGAVRLGRRLRRTDAAGPAGAVRRRPRRRQPSRPSAARRATASEQFLPAGQALPYTVRFENPAEATTRPSEVRIVTDARRRPRPRTFRLGDIRLGDINDQRARRTAPTSRATSTCQVAGLHPARVAPASTPTTRTASWVLQAIDPETGEVLQDATRGLLRPNNAQGAGAGFVSYTVQAAFGAASGDEIDRLGARDPRTTRRRSTPPTITQHARRAARRRPRSPPRRSARAATTTTCAGPPPTRPAARASSTPRSTCRDDGGDWQIWLRQTHRHAGRLSRARPAARYEFLALSTDNAGNRETAAGGAAAPDDGSQSNLGGTPDVGQTTQDVGEPPAPSTAPSTNPLFTAGRARRAGDRCRRRRRSSTRCSRRSSARASAPASRRATPASARWRCSRRPDGNFIASGGANRGALYAVRPGRRQRAQSGRARSTTRSSISPTTRAAAVGHHRRRRSSLELDPTTFAVLQPLRRQPHAGAGGRSGHRRALRLVRRRHRDASTRSRAPSATSATCASTTSRSRPTARCGAPAGRRAATCCRFDSQGPRAGAGAPRRRRRLHRLRPGRHAARRAAVHRHARRASDDPARREPVHGRPRHAARVEARARRPGRRDSCSPPPTAACWWPTRAQVDVLAPLVAPRVLAHRPAGRRARAAAARRASRSRSTRTWQRRRGQRRTRC